MMKLSYYMLAISLLIFVAPTDWEGGNFVRNVPESHWNQKSFGLQVRRQLFGIAFQTNQIVYSVISRVGVHLNFPAIFDMFLHRSFSTSKLGPLIEQFLNMGTRSCMVKRKYGQMKQPVCKYSCNPLQAVEKAHLQSDYFTR